MTSDDTPRAEAEREFDRRSLDKIAAAITDPTLRKQAQQLAAGTLSAGEFVHGMDRSPAALRGMDRYLNRYLRFTEQDLETIFARRDAEIGKVAAEMSAEQQPPPTAVDREAQALDEEETWENHSWSE